MLQTLFRLTARLPLSWLHLAGAALGWLTYALSPSYARRLRENLLASGVCQVPDCAPLMRQVVAETGKGALELIAIWFASDARIRSWLHCDSLHVLEQLRSRGKGVIVLHQFAVHLREAAQHIAALRELSPHVDKRPDHIEAHGRGTLTFQDIRRLECPVLREGIGERAPSTASGL